MTPRAARMLHIFGMIVWGAQMFGAAALMKPGWQLYLIEISLYANFVGHWSGFSAERPTEVITDGKES